MTDERQDPTKLRVESLRNRSETRFAFTPDANARGALSDELGTSAIRKLRFEGRVKPQGKSSWLLEADLGATVVQPCVVTLEPVTTRIDTKVERRFVPAEQIDREEGSETEMAEDDDSLEPLGPVIDLAAVMAEALALALPAYPRKDDVALEDAQFAEDGVQPMTDEDVKPFAGLAALRDKMKDDGETD